MNPKKNNRHFTPRELTVCKYLILGYSAIEMADALGISENTVNGNIKDIKNKLNISKTSRVVSTILNNGFKFDTENEIVYYNGVIINDDIKQVS